MKQEKQGYFLPMTQAAVDSIARHLDIPMAKPIFNLLQYKNTKGFSQEEIIRKFPELIDEERNYRFNLNRMRWEIEQLFNLTPPVVQNEIKIQLHEVILMLENLIKRKSVIKELEESNQFAFIHFPGEHGNLETLKLERKKSERLDAKLLDSPLVDEYLLLLSSMVDYFKLAILPFVNHPSLPELDDYNLPTDLGLYEDDDLRKYIEKWPEFIRICEVYSEPHYYEWTKRNKLKKLKDYRLIEKMDGVENYQWKGIESAPIPSLTDFFKMLASKGIFKLGNKTQQGKAIYKFFHLTGKKDPGFVLDDLFAATRKSLYEECFKREVGL
ncbi:MAG: hypothetical protein U0T74_14960 [Chitinophagales bacterium]